MFPVQPGHVPRISSELASENNVTDFLQKTRIDDLFERACQQMASNLQSQLDAHQSFCSDVLCSLQEGLNESKYNARTSSLYRCASAASMDTIKLQSMQIRMCGDSKQEDMFDDGAGAPRSAMVVSPPPSRVDNSTSQSRGFSLVSEKLRGLGLLKPSCRPATSGQRPSPSVCISNICENREWQDMSTIKRFVTSMQFDTAVCLLILSNCIFVGVQIEHHDSSFIVFEMIFCFFFFAELLLRALADPKRFLGRESKWNIFDSLCLVGSIIEIGVELLAQMQPRSHVMVLRCMRFLHFLRVTRMLRVRAFRELRLMVGSMLCCFKPFIWTLFLLMMEVYVFALLFTQGVREEVKSNRSLPDAHKNIFDTNFLTVRSSMYTLLSLILGGDDWLQYAVAFGSIHWLYKFLLFGYIIFTQLALLNVITAIFVDCAMNAALNDKQMLVQEEMIREGVSKAELEKLFAEASAGNSEVPVDQLVDFLEDDKVKTYMRVLGVNYRRPNDLAKALDADDNGEVNAQEFVKGCCSIRSARVVDSHLANQETLHIFQDMQQTLASMQRHMDHQILDAKANRKRLEPEQAMIDLSERLGSACSQLQDTRRELTDIRSNLGSLCSVLHRATSDIVLWQTKLQEHCQYNSQISQDLRSEWREDLDTLRTCIKQQFTTPSTLTKQEDNSTMSSARSCSTTTTDDTGYSTSETGGSCKVHHLVNSPKLISLPERMQVSHAAFSNPRAEKVPRLKSANGGPWMKTFKPLSLVVHSGDVDPPPPQLNLKNQSTCPTSHEQTDDDCDPEVPKCLGRHRAI